MELFAAAHACLVARDPGEKSRLVRELAEAFAGGGVEIGRDPAPAAVREAGRPARPRLVAPRELPRRRLGTREGRAALLHAIAHIEFNAINLACDAVYRFRDLPEAFYADWLQVAAEEAYHFSLVSGRLAELGHAYGDFPAHNGLWELAVETAGDPLLRMALVPRVMEARGLDVTPGIQARLEAVGDASSVAILEIILRDEVGHVAAGSRWFRHLCELRGLEPEATYFGLLEEHFPGGVRCPLHLEARHRAGFSDSELRRLEALCKRS